MMNFSPSFQLHPPKVIVSCLAVNLRFAVAIALLLASVSMASASKAANLTTDIENYLVSVSAGFHGSSMTMFGVVNTPGEIVTIVRGPPHDMLIRRKARVYGVYATTHSEHFYDVPSYYGIAVSKPHLLQELPSAMTQRYQIGLHNLYLPTPPTLTEGAAAGFRGGLIRNKIASGHYMNKPALIERRGKNLFRLSFNFPGNVPIGTYRVETYVINEGEVVAAQVSPLYVSKVGVNSKMFFLAHAYPLFFALIAVFGAVLIGLGAGAIFKRK